MREAMIAGKDTRLFGSVESAFLWLAPASIKASPSRSTSVKSAAIVAETMLVRSATLADAPTIAAIQVASWQAAHRGIMPDALLNNLSVDQRRQMWENRLVGPAAKAQSIFGANLMGKWS